jgi:tetratricopeptide (TPR) repeat protein
MKINKITLLFAAGLLAISSVTAQAQALKTPAPSPLQTTKQAFALGDVTIEYSRPAAKGRAIFGDLVPFGKIWRTGANGATKLTFTEDVKLEGNAVKAGTYALYTIPGKDNWEILLYKDLTLGGNVADYNNSNELLRFKVKPVAILTAVENFTIGMDAINASSAKLQLMWDKTLVPINITSDIDDKIMKNIDNALKSDSRPYFQAAGYYYDNNKDLKQALIWADKAIEQNPAFYIVHLKAKIQLKLKDNQGAIETAQHSMELSKEAKNDDYVKMNEKLIETAKKK